MIRKIAFTMYPVKEMARARQFYEKQLGLSVSKISDNGAWIEYDLLEGGCLAITTLAEGVEPSAYAGGCVALEVDNLDEMVDRLKNDNVKFKLDIFESPVCRMSVLEDSEGNAVILHQLNVKR